MSGQQIRTPLPVYVLGTISGNAGSPVITGLNTSWTTTDPNNNVINSIMGGDVLITPTVGIPIKSVDSATQITLEFSLQATINAGSAYRIIKYQPNVTGGVITALSMLQSQGTDAAPVNSATVDSGAGRVKTRIAPSGDAQIAVGPANASDAALLTVIDVSQAGVVTFPTRLDVARYKLAINAYLPGGVDQMFQAVVTTGSEGDPTLITWRKQDAPPAGAFEHLVLTWLQLATANGGLGQSPTAAAATVSTLRTNAFALTI